MNVMMQLRKVCKHPYLIQEAEDSITNDIKITYRKKDEDEKNEALHKVFFIIYILSLPIISY